MFLTMLWREDSLLCALWQGEKRQSTRTWRKTDAVSFSGENGKLDEGFGQEVMDWTNNAGVIKLEAVVWQNRFFKGLHETAVQLASDLAERFSSELFEVPLWWEEDLPEVAQYSGFPGITRRAVYDKVSHAAILAAQAQKNRLSGRFLVANFGDGTTVAAYDQEILLDCNNARDGEGPMGLTYSGTLPTEPFIQLVFRSGKPQSYFEQKLSESGYAAYEGVLTRREWEEIWLYQVLKEIGAMQAVLKMKADLILAVGTLSRDVQLMKRLAGRLPPALKLEIVDPDLLQGLANTWFESCAERKEKENA